MLLNDIRNDDVINQILNYLGSSPLLPPHGRLTEHHERGHYLRQDYHSATTTTRNDTRVRP